MSEESRDSNGENEPDSDSTAEGPPTDEPDGDPVVAAWEEAVETGPLPPQPDETTPSGDGADPWAAPHLSTNRLFEVLASPGNRFVLTYLLRVDSSAAYADIVEYVVSHADPPDGMTDGKFRGRVAATLVSETLPELREAGLVAVDGDSQTVSATPAIAAVSPHLALAMSDLVNPAEPGE